MISFRESEAVTVGSDHGERVGFKNQQTAIEGVTRFFHGDGKFRFADEALEDGGGNLHQRMRHCRKSGEILLGHADHLVLFLVADNLDPMIVEKFELDLTFGEEANEFE